MKTERGRKKQKSNVQPILPQETTRSDLPLVEYYAIHIHDRCKIELLLQILPSMSAKMSHLKRVENGRILIQPTEVMLSQELVEKLQTVISNVCIIKVNVPLRKPITRQQFLWTKQYWPTAFHCNKQNEALLDGTFFSIQEQLKIDHFYWESKKVGNGRSGCIFVDPNGNVVAKSGARNTPLGHAVMTAISDLCNYHRIENSNVSQYLGTGYDVYLTDEPCAMCAMALVHFRVRRVFYGKRTLSGGVYESSWRIQEEKSLNHHYTVFRIDKLS
ncbi:unnamed protein product [Thelazia callipaeda]|uniref:CMP/dCMP-type deaminase domain-containing protein n=1 Tax=Thelazia callipaeda TaxID=103827 RepID=A0A0N5CYM7_THECL|nr:unnamed protein product [Thelazia callipaeda]